MGSLRPKGLDFFLQGLDDEEELKRLRFLPDEVVDMDSSSLSEPESDLASGCGSAFAASLAVHACAKNGDDREHVLGKLALGGQRLVCFHCDRCTMMLEYSLEEIVCEAAKSVSVGNMHVSYTAFKDPLKKRQEAFALEIETRRAISEHDGGGMAQLEPFDLGLEVFDLLFGGDPCVDGVDPLCILLVGLTGLAVNMDPRFACVGVVCPKT